MAMSFPGESDSPSKDRGFADADDGFAAASAHRNDVPGRFEESGELDLGDEDVRLPWLEGDDDDEFDDGGSSTGQLIALVLLGLAALGLIVGGIWWWQRDRPDETLVADGATIAAPATPYKTKPANPGGNVVAGTGDTSFAVAEGQTRQVRMGSETAAPTPPPAKAEPSPSASASATAAAPSGASTDMSGPGVQVGAYSNRESAEKGWTRLSQQYEALSGVRYRIVEGRADIGTVYRLQAVPGDASAANRLCATLKGAGLSCQVKR
jgi:hypothetical protein